MSSFSDSDFEILDAWLEHRAKGIFDIVELEGFLTAVVIGPRTLSPLTWLPKVWGGRSPKFRDLDEMNRFTALVVGYYNEIVAIFEHNAQAFEPTFYESRVEGRCVLVVDEWCGGFMKGVRLDAIAWKPLRQDQPQLLKPLELFGTRAGWRELEAGGEAVMHATWSPRIAPAVRDIYAFWLKYRRAEAKANGVRHGGRRAGNTDVQSPL
jgi:uncharacterized protein